MDSLNVPVPPAVERLVESLRPSLSAFDSVRETPTLVAKRFDGAVPEAAVESEVRLALSGVEPFDVQVAGLGAFEAPVAGPAPVAYLAIESPGLEALHAELVDRFGAVSGLEGADYVPHVTLARGGPADALAALDGRDVEPVAWTVDELLLWDARRAEPSGRVRLE